MKNTIIAREHSFNNINLNTATNIIKDKIDKIDKNYILIAITMVEIDEKEFYKDDFSSVFEYGEKVLGYKHSIVYNMLKVGRQYLFPDTKSL